MLRTNIKAFIIATDADNLMKEFEKDINYLAKQAMKFSLYNSTLDLEFKYGEVTYVLSASYVLEKDFKAKTVASGFHVGPVRSILEKLGVKSTDLRVLA